MEWINECTLVVHIKRRMLNHMWVVSMFGLINL